jgi:hypothetical protein
MAATATATLNPPRTHPALPVTFGMPAVLTLATEADVVLELEFELKIVPVLWYLLELVLALVLELVLLLILVPVPAPVDTLVAVNIVEVVFDTLVLVVDVTIGVELGPVEVIVAPAVGKLVVRTIGWKRLVNSAPETVVVLTVLNELTEVY